MMTRHFQHLPKTYVAYPQLLRAMLRKKTDRLSLPELEYVVEQLTIDPQHLARYQALTGFAATAQVPALYVVMLSQRLQMQMMSVPEFPFQVLGLVHIANALEQRRPILAHEVMRLSCRFAALEPHAKGMAFDFVIEVSIQNEIVIQARSRYLVKQQTKKTQAKEIAPAQAVYFPKDEWQVEESVGRQYAWHSGDINLIHLHRLTANAFGFKRAIAHGMWSKAQVLSRLHLPDAYRVDVEFKLPIYLPSRVELLTAQNDHLGFLLRNTQDHRPHLIGSLISL